MVMNRIAFGFIYHIIDIDGIHTFFKLLITWVH